MRERIRDIIGQTCDEMGVYIVRGALAHDHVHMFLSVIASDPDGISGPA